MYARETDIYIFLYIFSVYLKMLKINNAPIDSFLKFMHRQTEPFINKIIFMFFMKAPNEV